MSDKIDLAIPGQPLKRFRLGYHGKFIDSYDTARAALEGYESHEKLRSILDRKGKGRYSIRDGRDKEITIVDLRLAAAKEPL